jgi:glycosyltransferase involved in cell wall biosynthesis
MSILVSINCTAYNQENYIAKAIESFLMQKTDFEYEILIGEDCSTDNTRKIANEYAEKYPNIIKIITYDRNIGSVKNSIRLIEESKGKYIAICESDDYWTDADKLQKQVDFMTEHPYCSMCYHDAEVFNMITNSSEGSVRPYKKTCVLPSDKLFFGGGHEVPTASILFVKEFMNNTPQFVIQAPVMDHPLALILSYHGRIGYIDEVMAVRSLWVPNSWNTNFILLRDDNKKIEHIRAMIELLYEFDIYSKSKYSSQIKKRVLSGEMEILQIQGEDPFLDRKFLSIYNSFKKLDQFKIRAIYKMPKLSNKYMDLKKFISSFFIGRTI